jgi:DNA-binding LytR/AlgR family response regulator
MRIAVCDDEPQQVDVISAYIAAHSAAPAVTRYSSAAALIEQYRLGARYDLILMDIQMEGLNGFEAAKILRRLYPDEKPRIAFFTVTDVYAQLGYGIGVWDYLSKPTSRERVWAVLDRALTELSQESLLIPTAAGTRTVRLRNTLYVEAHYGATVVHTREQNHVTSLTLTDMASKLPSATFCQIHRCYLINLAHVTQYNKTRVCIADRTELSLGRTYRDHFSARLTAYLRGIM